MRKTKDNETHCDSCGIIIGPGYLERKPYKFNKYTFCKQCYERFQKDGYMQLDDLLNYKGRITTCTWLFLDGQTQKMRLDRNKQGEFIFVPVKIQTEDKDE